MATRLFTVAVSPSHRQTASHPLVLSTDISNRMRADSTLKLLMFCAIEEPLQNYVVGRDITFPSQIEVRVNGDDVKANFKGLKNKPGSTRPADITSLVRITPTGYKNTIQITYALTQKESSEVSFCMSYSFITTY
jgi:E3 SUMO-protein ligase PIAS1